MQQDLARDTLLALGRSLGWMHGLPLAAKDTANLEMKEKALARLQTPDIKLPRFRADDDLMKFLQSLELWKVRHAWTRSSTEWSAVGRGATTHS